MRSALRLSLITLCTATTWLASSSDVTAHAPTSFEAPIAQPSTSSIGPDQYVVSFAVGGDLHGLLTLTLTRSGSTASGEWALVTSSVPEGDSEHAEGDHEHAGDGEEPGEPHVDLGPPTFSGTLAGSVTNAELVFDDQGALIAIDAASLSVESGSARFEGSTGSGTAEATSIDPNGAAVAAGTLKLLLSTPQGEH